MTLREFHNLEHLINAYTWGDIQRILFAKLDVDFKKSKRRKVFRRKEL